MQHIGDKLVFQIQHYLRATYARRLCHRQNGQNAAIIGALTLISFHLCTQCAYKFGHLSGIKSLLIRWIMGQTSNYVVLLVNMHNN